MIPTLPQHVPIHLNDFRPSFITEDPIDHGFVIGSDNGVLAFTDEVGKEVRERFPVSESKEAINGVANFGDYLAVSTGDEVTIVGIPPNQDGRVRADVIPQGAHGVLAVGGKHFLAPVGHEGILVVTPTAESLSQNRIDSFPGPPLNFYQLCGLPSLGDRYYLVAACRSSGIGIIDMSISSPAIGLRIGAFADVVDVAYLGNAAYPFAVAAVGIRGEVFLCRDIVRQEPPITLHYQNLAGKVYRILAGQGHLFILTSKAMYIFGNLASRLVQPVFDKSQTPVMTIPMKALDAEVIADKWLSTVMSDAVNRFDINLIDQRIAESGLNGVAQQPLPCPPMAPAWIAREFSFVGQA